MRALKILAAVVLGMVSASAQADVKCASVFTDHMVLQRDIAAPVWGTADAGETVTVKIADQTKTAQPGADGKWIVKLDALKSGGAPLEMTVSGKNTIKFTDVLVGEVWICSGQSNMEWALSNARDGQQEVEAANYPQIRLFAVPKLISRTPVTETKATWQPCSPKNAGGFSAVGYFFGRHLHKELNVPVGLIGTNWGGTPAEAWTDAATLKADAEYQSMLERPAKYAQDYPKLLAKYEADNAKWKEAVTKAKAEKKEAPKPPRKPAAPGNDPHEPSVLYNGMITPLAPYAIRGAIWYQGESNASRAYQYRKLLPDMIKSWRTTWGQGDFHFLVVQLANFMRPGLLPADSIWAELREAQTLTAKNVPNCGMAVITDIGEADNIHPKNKQDVGRRLGLVAEKQAYGRDVIYAGPTYESCTIEADKVRIKFSSIGGGLVVKGDKLDGFVIAAADKKFVLADAKIDGDSVIVWSDQVKQPAAVRYDWANNPPATLFNKAGLPAGPFRTDDWPGVTAGAK